jgi:hypothetical protein
MLHDEFWDEDRLSPELATAMGLAVAARSAATPETNRHTSLHQRVEHAAAQRRLDDLKAACGSVATTCSHAGRIGWSCFEPVDILSLEFDLDFVLRRPLETKEPIR